MVTKTLDIISLGRLGIDLYAEQVGARLEDASSTAKYLGGSSGNIAYGTARLGLKSAMLTRLGDEQVGRFLTEELNSVGCDTSQITYDPERLTGLVLLGIKDKDTFPLIFYRENCADMAIREEDIHEDFIASSEALVMTGTHLSTPEMNAVCRKAIKFATMNGTKTALDIDYRPVLWGLTGKGEGENRFVSNESVTQHLQSVLPLFDLIVGTEEEIHIAGGSEDTIECLKIIRQLSEATIVVKRGPLGASVFTDDIPDTLDKGITGKGVQVEVLNVLGAGDAFMSGFLRGWVKGESHEQSLAYANACGALVVSRHGCAPAMPSSEELQYYLDNTDTIPQPDQDEHLNYLHTVTTRKRKWTELCVFAFDHRLQLLDMAMETVGHDNDLPKLKSLLLQGAYKGADIAGLSTATNSKLQPGLLCDDQYGQDALNDATGRGWWIGRPVENPSSRPIDFEYGDNVGQHLITWPEEHVVKCLVFYHPDDPVELRLEQERKVVSLYEACRFAGNELLLELIPPKDGVLPVDGTTLVRSMTRFYNLGVKPDWWKVPVQEEKTWQQVDQLIDERAPHCRGVVLLGLDQPTEVLAEGFKKSANAKWVKGFMVGRTLFGEPCRQWLTGNYSDEQLIDATANNYANMVKLWNARKGGK